MAMIASVSSDSEHCHWTLVDAAENRRHAFHIVRPAGHGVAEDALSGLVKAK